MKRERIEDLGCLAIMLDNLYEDEIFKTYHGRNKDAIEWFRSLDEEKQNDLIHSYAYGLSNLQEKLCECLQLAQGDYFHGE